ncbi:hypothetical protein [Oceanithermus sp.]
MSIWILAGAAVMLFLLYFIADSARKTTQVMLEGKNAIRNLPFPVGERFVQAYRRADDWARSRGYQRREIIYFSLVPEEDLMLTQGHAEPDDAPYWLRAAFWWHPEKKTVFSITQVQHQTFADFDTALGRPGGEPAYELTTSNHPDGAVVPRPERFPVQVFPGLAPEGLEPLHERALAWLRRQTGLEPLELGEIVAHVRRHLKNQAEHALAHKPWHLRFYLWHLTKRARLNRPVQQLYARITRDA